MSGMAHDHSAMNHPGVETMKAVLASQSCQPNCATAERLAFSRKIIPQVTVIRTGAVVLDTAAKSPVPDPAAAWILGSGPPSPTSAYAASFNVLRI